MSEKYPRTYHFPFSPGKTSDDKTNWEWKDILEKEVLITEKLDGENTCLKKEGAFSRSHAAPSRNPWAKNMWEIWENIRHEIGDYHIFGENIYAIHSIEYDEIESYFYIFGIREGDKWLSWDETTLIANCLQLPLVPVLCRQKFNTPIELEEKIIELSSLPSSFGMEREGVVVRNAASYSSSSFKENVIKYVRANHVQTDVHWTRNWKRAPLVFEKR